MSADSNSKIAWHRVQLRKNRDALKALETARFTIGEVARGSQTQNTIADLERKIAESQRCIAEYDRQSRRPVATDLQSLSSVVNWSTWSARGNGSLGPAFKSTSDRINAPPPGTPKPATGPATTSLPETLDGTKADTRLPQTTRQHP